jgi:hypothetical protein
MEGSIDAGPVMAKRVHGFDLKAFLSAGCCRDDSYLAGHKSDLRCSIWDMQATPHMPNTGHIPSVADIVSGLGGEMSALIGSLADKVNRAERPDGQSAG